MNSVNLLTIIAVVMICYNIWLIWDRNRLQNKNEYLNKLVKTGFRMVKMMEEECGKSLIDVYSEKMFADGVKVEVVDGGIIIIDERKGEE